MQRFKGFSLIELMIVVMLIGILSAIALPSYRQYRVSANRGAAKAVLLEIASKQEEYIGRNGAFAAGANWATDLHVSVPAEVDREYSLTVAAAAIPLTGTLSAPGFTATATPKAGSLQESANDGAIAINQFGLKTPVGKW